MPVEFVILKWFLIIVGGCIAAGIIAVIIECSDGAILDILEDIFGWIGSKIHALTCVPKFKANIDKMDKESLLAYKGEINYWISEARDNGRSPDKLIRKLSEVNDRLNKLESAEKYDKMAEDKWKYLTKV